MLLYIITNAVLFSYVLTNENIPSALADWILDQNLGWVGFLLVVNILLLIAGNFMEPSSIILIMAPILAPAAKKLGIDPCISASSSTSTWRSASAIRRSASTSTSPR